MEMPIHLFKCVKNVRHIKDLRKQYDHIKHPEMEWHVEFSFLYYEKKKLTLKKCMIGKNLMHSKWPYQICKYAI